MLTPLIMLTVLTVLRAFLMHLLELLGLLVTDPNRFELVSLTPVDSSAAAALINFDSLPNLFKVVELFISSSQCLNSSYVCSVMFRNLIGPPP